MDGPTLVEQDAYEWRRCSILFPRVGKLLNRDGLHTRLLLPGAYYVRWSRSVGTRIYRVRTS